MNSVVVSDTGPLNYLVIIGCVEILPQLFSQVFIPKKVLEELLHEKTPPAAKLWAQNLPSWVAMLDVEENSQIEEFANLDAGEVAALSLAVQMGSRFILIDDYAARLVAENLGLIPIGTLGLLLSAEDAGLLDFDEAVNKLLLTNFHVSTELIKKIQTRRKPQK